jgi:hypothetical protein
MREREESMKPRAQRFALLRSARESDATGFVRVLRVTIHHQLVACCEQTTGVGG